MKLTFLFLIASFISSSMADTISYTVTAVSGKFRIDGIAAPSLNFLQGNTYVFDISDASLTSHPFKLSTIANSGEYTSGVSSTASTVQIVVNGDTPSTLYYYCDNHENMGADITVSPASCNSAYSALGRTYDANAPACAIDGNNVVTSTSQCQCTGCGQIQVYMAEEGEKCNNGTWSAGCTDGSCDVNCVGEWSAWSVCSATCGPGTQTRTFTTTTSPTGSGQTCADKYGTDFSQNCNEQDCPATCDSFKCHVAFTLRENPETIYCASTVCDKREDLYTCCEAADALYNRDMTGKNDCHDANCDGNGNKCVDLIGKVLTSCICKNTYRVDDIVTAVNDHCEEDGLYSDGSVTDVENFGYVPSYTVTHKSGSPTTIGCAKTCEALFEDMTTKILRGSATFGLAICKDHLECSLCPKCIQAAETYDWAFMPPRVQTGNVVGGGCYPWCEPNFEGTFGSCTTEAPCGNTKLENAIAIEIAEGRLDDNQEAKNKYRKSRLCSWNKCGGCKKCLEHADTDDYGGKAALVDEDGSSTTWVGGCSWWCQRNFDAEDVDSIPNENLKNRANAYVGTLSEKLEFARSVVSGWKRCSGCKKIKEWANDATADWRSKRALVDYSGQENTRRKSKRTGKCDAITCKEDFEAAATDEEKEEICASYNCNGCGKCGKWVTELSTRDTSDTFRERVSKSVAKTIDSMKVGDNFATVATVSGSNRRKGGCAGYPICRERLQATDCKKLYCEGCDFCAE